MLILQPTTFAGFCVHFLASETFCGNVTFYLRMRPPLMGNSIKFYIFKNCRKIFKMEQLMLCLPMMLTIHIVAVTIISMELFH